MTSPALARVAELLEQAAAILRAEAGEPTIVEAVAMRPGSIPKSLGTCRSPMKRVRAIWESMNRRFPKRQGHCTACGVQVQKPRTSWCSQTCVDAYLDLRDADRYRRILAARDSQCDLCRFPVWVDLAPGDLGFVAVVPCLESFWSDKLPIGFMRRCLDVDRGWWGDWICLRVRTIERDCEADHRIPLVEGGEHDWSNLRLLCKPCHKSETAALAARRAQRRVVP